MAPPKKAPTPCKIEWCDRPTKARGWCNLHYLKWRKHGDPLVVINRRQHSALCAVEGCGQPYKAKGYCNVHFLRWRAYGDPLHPIREKGRGFVNADGYRVLYRPEHPNATAKGMILEHRLVMAEMLGRPLYPDETVHHKNGIKGDNRPANLELRLGRHGKHADVADLVAWAREILRRYEHTSLAVRSGPDRSIG